MAVSMGSPLCRIKIWRFKISSSGSVEMTPYHSLGTLFFFFLICSEFCHTLK